MAISYGYDNASELTGLTYTLGSTTLGNLTYAYDSAGRRISLGGTYAQTELPSAVSTTSYNAGNQLITWGSASPSYDANGNLTSDGTNTYSWNARNKLASMNSSAISFQYDPYGRRVAKTVSGVTKNYLYDRDNIAQELSGGSVLSNWLTGATDEIFTGTDSTGTVNFLRDALGSTLALTNSSGSSIAQYAYEPFGNTTVTSGSSTNEFQYTGRENDGTGVDYYRARYYSPKMQRFLSEDPTRLMSGDVNFYAYVYNDPIRYRDPNGTDAVGGALFGGVAGYLNACAHGSNALLGALIGAVVGGAAGAFNPASGFGGAILGGLAGGAENAVDQAFNGNGGGFDWGDLGKAVASGAVGGFAGSFFGGFPAGDSDAVSTGASAIFGSIL